MAQEKTMGAPVESEEKELPNLPVGFEPGYEILKGSEAPLHERLRQHWPKLSPSDQCLALAALKEWYNEDEQVTAAALGLDPEDLPPFRVIVGKWFRIGASQLNKFTTVGEEASPEERKALDDGEINFEELAAKCMARRQARNAKPDEGAEVLNLIEWMKKKLPADDPDLIQMIDQTKIKQQKMVAQKKIAPSLKRLNADLDKLAKACADGQYVIAANKDHMMLAMDAGIRLFKLIAPQDVMEHFAEKFGEWVGAKINETVQAEEEPAPVEAEKAEAKTEDVKPEATEDAGQVPPGYVKVDVEKMDAQPEKPAAKGGKKK